MIYVLVTGFRDWDDSHAICYELDYIKNFSGGEMMVIQGGCPSGADLIAKEWAEFYEIPCLTWPARWKYGGSGKAEGPKRNAAMTGWAYAINDSNLRGRVICLAFDHPDARGTKDCIRAIEDLDLTLKVITPEGVVYERQSGQPDQQARYSRSVRKSSSRN